MKTFKCTDEHEAVKKLNLLYNFMNELGISLQFNNGKWSSSLGAIIDGKEYYIADTCADPFNDECIITEFPPVWECNLYIEKESAV